jgi:vanillate O-demethylase ferredoxin subunit
MHTATHRVRVTRKFAVAANICAYELTSVDGHALPPFSAGSHIDVFLANGITRQYSLCNPPSERHRYLIAVLKDPASRGGSKAMHEDVHEGDELTISAPRNHFSLAHPPEKSLLLAGGVGITPILCMAERLEAIGEEFELHYAARSEATMAFRRRILDSPFARKVHFHFNDGGMEQKLDLGALLRERRPDTHLYVCGPKGFMEAVLDTARSSSWPEAKLHYEFFGAAPIRLATDGSFQVQIASTGERITVPPEQTVVAALSAVGIDIQVSCEQGVCGTCLTRVLEGTPDHRDLFLTQKEQAKNDQFTPCCSRSKSAFLTLDL